MSIRSCAECGRETNELEEVVSCCETDCCVKFVCLTWCTFTCEKCKTPVNYKVQDFCFDDLICPKCKYIAHIFTWWGFTPQQYYDEYGKWPEDY